MTEIAYSRSGYIRLVQDGKRFDVQTLRIRGEHKLGSPTYWKTLYGIWNREKAIVVLESYCGAP